MAQIQDLKADNLYAAQSFCQKLVAASSTAHPTNKTMVRVVATSLLVLTACTHRNLCTLGNFVMYS